MADPYDTNALTHRIAGHLDGVLPLNVGNTCLVAIAASPEPITIKEIEAAVWNIFNFNMPYKDILNAVGRLQKKRHIKSAGAKGRFMQYTATAAGMTQVEQLQAQARKAKDKHFLKNYKLDDLEDVNALGQEFPRAVQLDDHFPAYEIPAEPIPTPVPEPEPEPEPPTPQLWDTAKEADRRKAEYDREVKAKLEAMAKAEKASRECIPALHRERFDIEALKSDIAEFNTIMRRVFDYLEYTLELEASMKFWMEEARKQGTRWGVNSRR